MDATEIVEDLQTYHGQKFVVERLSDYVWFFDGHGDDSKEILDDWKRQNAPSARFPSIAQLLTVAEAVRVRKWQRQKELEPTFKEFAEQTSSRSEHGKVALREMVAHLNWDRNDPVDKERRRREYVAWMRSMEDRFPGFGWREEAAKLEQWYAEEPARCKKTAWVMERMELMRELNGVYGKHRQ